MQSSLTVFEILKLHHSNNHKDSLSLSIGDGYLYAHNPLYKAIRIDYVKLGYTFTTEDFCHYVAMPFLSLSEILKHKKTPYFNNVTPIELIENHLPKTFKCEEIIKPKTNHVLHESSHCLADAYLKKIKVNVVSLKNNFLSPEQTKTLEMIMAESFANTVESFCNTYNTTPESRLFFEMNSYIVHYKKISKALSETILLIGAKKTFQLIYISYLCSNCLMNEIGFSQLTKIINSFFDASTAEIILKNKCCTQIFNHAFELSMDFRLQTTGFYCQMMGLKADIFKLVDIDLVTLLTKTQIVQNFLNQSEHLIFN
jgi:hypothetical protein